MDHPHPPAIWIVDDDPSIRFVLERALAREGLASRSFASADAVRQALHAAAAAGHGTPQVLLSDIRMPGDSGLQLLAELRQQLPRMAVIVMTAYSDLDSAVAAFQGGAFDYLSKPFDVQQAVALVRRALPERGAGPAGDPPGEAQPPEMLGQAPAMQEVFRAIGRLSQSLASVLVTGETGTGKELVARALHRHSPVAGGPFVAINTAAIPRELLESELFGHERGAFTGAAAQRRGHFEQADGGTLFLDEIGDMPLELQTRLLRVLSEGQFHRVGGHVSVHVRVRVIAATHQDLEQRVRAGSFREDLFHRLNVIRLRLPPLRERSLDVPMLARHFLALAARQLGVAPKRLDDEAMACLARYAFPGNVRQLENICHWLTVMAPAQMIASADLPPEVRADSGVTAAAAPVSPQAGAGGWEAALAQETRQLLDAGRAHIWTGLAARFEAVLIRSALQATQGRRIEAAQRLGMGRNTLARKLHELRLDTPEGSPADSASGTGVRGKFE
ncbi:two-component system, NtrC family, nitrogen regulation response regulator GlnG [Oryzisolibacter propanilivorax]|uniref:DNA-binding transcriptional regulator NtrC n=1 Tax=Oryzisolibacter propanilivorax TaxID=1527607 RepID=A0A1G9NW20_9BURK|nr:nitrogen regulation protein NR(I) [Oryzisolibacter propanilivorax]SDL90227.1 two-component system, NtrC family, nitrogen regulation response regulator GlnG [Oryzisolibacter propanilivorax]